MGHDPTSMAERKADDERQAPRLRNLLATCEQQLAMANQEVSDRDAEIARLKAAFDSESTLRAYRDEQLRLLHKDSAAFVRERNEARHEVETWQREYSGALADFEHAQAEIARLKAELAAERGRTVAIIDGAAGGSQPPPTPAEIRTYMDRLANQPRAGGYVPPPAPPAEDPRIAALCVIVRHLIYHANYRGNQAFDDALLIINEGRR